MSAESSERTLALWCPAWAVATACRADPSLAGVPLAVMERGARGLVVRAASAEARAEGVTVGLRRREAEARCDRMLMDTEAQAKARMAEAEKLSGEQMDEADRYASQMLHRLEEQLQAFSRNVRTALESLEPQPVESGAER